jgi:hypothetical protein
MSGLASNVLACADDSVIWDSFGENGAHSCLKLCDDVAELIDHKWPTTLQRSFVVAAWLT